MITKHTDCFKITPFMLIINEDHCKNVKNGKIKAFWPKTWQNHCI